MRRVDTNWKVIEGVLWEHAHSVFNALRRAAAPDKVAALEKALQAELPADFKRSLYIHDGLSSSGQTCFFDGMVLLATKAILSEWRMRCEAHSEDDPGGCPETTDKRIKNDRWWRPGWVPFMAENENMLLIDLDPGPEGATGQVFKFYNSAVRPRQVIAKSYAEWLSAVADALATRKFRLSESGDIWLDDHTLA